MDLILYQSKTRSDRAQYGLRPSMSTRGAKSVARLSTMMYRRLSTEPRQVVLREARTGQNAVVTPNLP